MTSKTFIPGTVVDSPWLNDVNSAVYKAASGLGIGVVDRPALSKFADTVNVRDFGAKGDGVTDDTVAFLAARNYLQTASNYRGGRILVGRGYFKLSQEWAFTPYVAGQVFNIEIEGDGPETTVLDFAAAPPGSSGISAIGQGVSFFVRNLSVKSAPVHGIRMGGTSGTSDYLHRCGVSNVRIQACGQHGLYSSNSFMFEIDKLWSFGNAGNGVHFVGFHTSLNFRLVASSQNTGFGMLVNGAIYSKFDTCGVDYNGQYGYSLSNVQAVDFDNCGAESNGRSGWMFFTSDASVGTLPSAVQNVRGVSLNGCYGLNNSLSSPGTYASFVEARTNNGRPIFININGGAAYGATASDLALVLDGSSGSIVALTDGFDDSGCVAANGIYNAAEWRNRTVASRRAIAPLSAATQAVANNSLVNLSIVATSVNDLGASVASNAIVIPRGVNKVVVSVGVVFAASATGVRQVFLRKNGIGLIGLPSVTQNAAAAGSTNLAVSSAPISVIPGDTISASVFQNTGGTLDVSQSTYTYLSVEAVG